MALNNAHAIYQANKREALNRLKKTNNVNCEQSIASAAREFRKSHGRAYKVAQRIHDMDNTGWFLFVLGELEDGR